MQFSVIIPVYNVSSYIKGCLDSLKKQKCSDVEIIIVNDGSTDNSLEVINDVIKNDKRFRVFTKTNGGVSDARNYGIKKASGKYLLFIDSDDSVRNDYFEIIRRTIDENNCPDIIRFQLTEIEGDVETKLSSQTFPVKSGSDSFKTLSGDVYFDTTWNYAYRHSFFKKNKFVFAKNRYHEDFGLIPYIILKASTVCSISDNLYNYYKRPNSITTAKDNKKIIKRAEDTLFLANNLITMIEKANDIDLETKKFAYSYVANAVLVFGNILDKKDMKFYLKFIKENKLVDFLLDDTLIRKLKKIIVRISPYFYIKYIAK